MKLLPKIKIFGWKLAANTVAVRENLSRRGVQTSLTCLLCDQVESREHLIMGCAWVQPNWRKLLDVQVVNDGCRTMEEWLVRKCSEKGTLRSSADHRWKITLTTCWAIWKARCVMVIQGRELDPMYVIIQARKLLQELKSFQKQNPRPNKNTTGAKWERSNQ